MCKAVDKIDVWVVATLHPVASYIARFTQAARIIELKYMRSLAVHAHNHADSSL